mmetsp:Transcript_139915/g.390004  ORF Transcript_139915/g.390004 Transcript_139915/m.390004 type:complete len:251 (+) Transcript_139915:384-1136(+)
MLGPEHVNEAAHGDPAWNVVACTLVEHAGHQDNINGQADEDVPQRCDPEVPAQVRLPSFCKGDQVAVHNPADEEVQKRQQVHGRTQGAEHDADQEINGPASAARTQPVVVLILWLRHGCSLLWAVECEKSLELKQVHVAQYVHAVRRPLQNHVVHVEVGGEGQGRAQEVEDRQGTFGHRDQELREVPAHGRGQEHEDNLEPEVIVLQPMLRPSICLECEEPPKDDNNEGRQEGDHDGQAKRGRQARPEWL